MSKTKAIKYRFKVGDIIEAQVARLTVTRQITTPEGLPAYEVRSPFTRGESWFVSERAVEFCRKVRIRKKAS